MPQGELSTSLDLDRDIYAASDLLSARFGVRKLTDDPVTLSFFTSEIYDLEIRDGNGSVVYLWSRGQSFAQFISDIEFDAEKDYIITVPLAKLPPGKYVAQAWFTAAGPPRAYSASARFRIQ